jgi:hypothetical protein
MLVTVGEKPTKKTSSVWTDGDMELLVHTRTKHYKTFMIYDTATISGKSSILSNQQTPRAFVSQVVPSGKQEFHTFQH